MKASDERGPSMIGWITNFIGNSSWSAWIAFLIFSWAIFYLIILVFVYPDLTLLDHYFFRQTQTASVIREIVEGGPWVNYRLPVFGPPWTAPMEFPVYQILVAELSRFTGLGVETSARVVNLASTVGVFLSAWRITHLAGLNQRTQFFVVLMLVASPMLLYWSFAVMIEVFAVFVSIAFVMCSFEFLTRARVWPLTYGVLFAIIAALAKVTTFAIFAVFTFTIFVIYFIKFAAQHRSEFGRVFEHTLKLFAFGIGLFLPALLIGSTWVHYSDSLKLASPLTTFLTSQSLSSWNFGSDFERGMNMRFLVNPFHNMSPSIISQMIGVFSGALLLLAAAGHALTPKKSLLILFPIVFAFFVGPVVFSNLYYWHYYYYVATVVFLCAFTGIGISNLVGAAVRLPVRLPNLTLAPAVTVGTALVLVLSGAITYHAFYLNVAINADRTVELIGQEVQARTLEAEVVYIAGYDWNPAIQYYSHRDFLMIRDPSSDLALDHGQATGTRPALFLACNGQVENAGLILEHPVFQGREWRQVETVGFCDFYEPT